MRGKNEILNHVGQRPYSQLVTPNCNTSWDFIQCDFGKGSCNPLYYERERERGAG